MKEVAICQAAKYITWPNGRMPRHNNEYYSWCKTQKVPYVRIDVHGNHANVRMDCPSNQTKMDDLARAEVRALLQRLGCPGRLDYESIHIEIAELPLDVHEELATGLYFIALRFGRRTQLVTG